MARLARLGVLVGVALVGYGCTAAKPHERATGPAGASDPSDAGSDCPRYDALKSRLDVAVASGHVLLARRLLAWRQLLRCQVGARELPLEFCLDAWLEPGIGARRLLPGRSDL